MSALPPKADMRSATRDVRFGPIADISLTQCFVGAGLPAAALRDFIEKLCERVHKRFARTTQLSALRAFPEEAHMRRILNAALVLGGSFVGVTASPNTSLAKIDATENHLIVHGLYVALPTNMKNVPVELVTLP